MLAGLVVMIFVLRSRNFTDRRQAVPLICGAAAAVCAGVARYVWAAPAGSTGALVGGALVLTGFGAGTLIAALLVPPTRFTPGPDDRRMAGTAGDRRRAAAGRLDRRPVRLGADAMTARTAQRAAAVAAVLMLAGYGLVPARAIPAGGGPHPTAGGGPARSGRADASGQPLRPADHRRRPGRRHHRPGFTMLNIARAWTHSTGNGVPVAVVDTG